MKDQGLLRSLIVAVGPIVQSRHQNPYCDGVAANSASQFWTTDACHTRGKSGSDSVVREVSLRVTWSRVTAN